MDTRSRQRWNEQQIRKEPSLYDEWLNEEKKENHSSSSGAVQTKAAPALAKTRRHGSTAGVSVSAPGTMLMTRNELQPNEEAAASRIDQDVSSSGMLSAQTTTRTTTTTAAAAAHSTPLSMTRPSNVIESSNSPSPVVPLSLRSSRRKELVNNNELMEALTVQRIASTARSSESAKGKGMLGRRSSRSSNNTTNNNNNNASPPAVYADSSRTSAISSPSSTRPRTRTLDDRRGVAERTPANSDAQRQRQRVKSIHAGGHVKGSDFLASVPANTSPPVTTTINTFASPVRRPDMRTQRDNGISEPDHTITASNGLPKRIQHLMKALNGRMSGVLVFRRTPQSSWVESYCSIQEESASLVYESSAGDGSLRTLVSDLRGCHIEFGRSEDYIPHVILRSARTTHEVHLRIHNQTEFDSWIAALLTWQTKGQRREQPQLQPAHITTSPAVLPPPLPPNPTPRRSSAARSISPHTRKRADSDRSQHRRKSVVMSLKEAPVIKIGKMIFWDTDVTYGTNPANVVGQPASGRPQAYRMQSYGSRRWRRISALLRENGELKLHADHDNSLLSVVQLSQLSRCAIQRLDQSVLENEFCVAIYPQYTSTPTDSTNIIRPIFLSLESRVLHEVWFVLLRAFTIPQLYGPRLPEDVDSEAQDPARDLEEMLAEQTTDMFRMERSLSVRVVEAKIYNTPLDTPNGRNTQHSRPEQYGYHVELLLDNETRAKTAVKFEGLNPLWGETFEFADLPPVLTSASVVIKRRPPDAVKMAQDGRMMYDSSNFTSDAHGGFSGINFDVACGKVEIYLDELAATNEAERWWPVVNMFNQRVGEVLVKARADEGVVLMARDYQPLSDLLHKFSNGLSLQLAQIVPAELRRLSDCLLNIYQVSGHAGDWIMALVEDEIDSINKETPITRLRYNGRTVAAETNEQYGSVGSNSDRELMVRDMNKNATLEANLLFRGNTLLTKSLDTHMRRVGKDFLEEALAAKLREICERDPDCEVDPNRASELEVSRNWRRLISLTSEVWKSIVAAKHKCPIELRRIFRHIRACAEDRYGDFLRSVSYSSVSGFLFLRFFCPAVLNPKLFGLFKDDIKPKGRRTLTLIAKSLQTLANMASFGTKEQWMEPMNIFLNQSREAFKNFIDDICYVPVPVTSRNASISSIPATAPVKIVSADTHLSYTTPMTIMQRLPPTSREGFPSLPYLIDQPRAFADLVQLWLETTSDASNTRDMAFPGKSKADLLNAIRRSDGDVREFHDVCVKLNARTQECLSRAERAERPHSALSFQWEELIDQLQSPSETDVADEESPMPKAYEIANRVKPDMQVAEPSVKNAQVEHLIGSLGLDNSNDAQLYGIHPSKPQPVPLQQSGRSRNNSSREDYRSHIKQSRALQSRSSESPASPTDAGHSTVSSDTDGQGTTALPDYEREVLQRRREELEQQDRQAREHGEKRQGMKFVSALRKKNRDAPPSR